MTFGELQYLLARARLVASKGPGYHASRHPLVLADTTRALLEIHDDRLFLFLWDGTSVTRAHAVHAVFGDTFTAHADGTYEGAVPHEPLLGRRTP